MTPASIIQKAQADGVKLALSPYGTIKARGDGAAVNRWLAVIRESKAEIVEALKGRASAPMTAKEERAIRAWLEYIEETDPKIIAEVIDKCQRDDEARPYFLTRAEEVPPPPEPDYTATCGACRHLQRIDHPNLGHCEKGEPEAPAGLWDTDSRWCEQYPAIQKRDE